MSRSAMAARFRKRGRRKERSSERGRVNNFPFSSFSRLITRYVREASDCALNDTEKRERERREREIDGGVRV